MNAQVQQRTALEKGAASVLVTKLKVMSPDVAKYLDWLARLMMQGFKKTGCLSAEILSSAAMGKLEWVLVQQLRTPSELEALLLATERKELIEELQPDCDSLKVSLSESNESKYRASISVAVVTQVKKGYEEDYFEFEQKFQAAQAKTPGYRGTYVQPPFTHKTEAWTTIIHYDSQESMEQWLQSDERKKLLAESDQLIHSTDFQNVTSFPGWFGAEADKSRGPPNWKTALLILLGLYPSVMIVIIYFLPLMQGYPLALNNFLGNILTVAFTTWVTMPICIKMYNSWLFPNESTPKWVPSLSVVSLFIFFVIEVTFFWSIF